MLFRVMCFSRYSIVHFQLFFLLQESWFVENMLEPIADAIRSLLGGNFVLPVGTANHQECPEPPTLASLLHV